METLGLAVERKLGQVVDGCQEKWGSANPDPIKMTRPRAVLGQTLQRAQIFGSLAGC